MAKRMTSRERVEAALRMEPVDQVPLMSYPGMPPIGEEERRLRERALGYCGWCNVFTQERPNVQTEQLEYSEQGVRYRRVTHRTPVGEVHALYQIGGVYGTSWTKEFPVKTPDDYRVAEFIWKDTVYKADYDQFPEAVKNMGEDGYVLSWYGYSPLLEMRANLLGLERFSIDMYERPDLFFSLYEAIRDNHRKVYPILANSPAHVIEYDGNATSDVMGIERFEKYILPCYNELGEQLHANGKILSTHMDGEIGLWKKQIADSALDMIDAFTPAPDTSLNLAEARAAWPNKIFWLNYPSSVHLASYERVKAETHKLLQDAAPGHGLVIGFTENIPEHVWRTSLYAIIEALEEDAQTRL